MKKTFVLVLIAAALFFIFPTASYAEWGGIWASVMGGDDPDDINIQSQIDAMPSGGSAGQVLTKFPGGDYVTGWTTLPNWSPQITGLDSRLSDLEETQYVFGLNLRLYDSRKMSWNVFANYSANRSKLDRVGIDLTLKLGKSYEEKQIEELRGGIAELKSLLQNQEQRSTMFDRFEFAL